MRGSLPLLFFVHFVLWPHMAILCIIVSCFTIITNTILPFVHFQLIQKNNFPRLYGIVHYIIWFALVYHCLSFGYNEQFALRKIWGLLNLNLLLSRTADVASSMYSAHASSVVISLAVQTIIMNSALAWLFLFFSSDLPPQWFVQIWLDKNYVSRSMSCGYSLP